MAKEKSGSLLSSIKNQIEKSGNSKGSLFFVKSGDKARVRFLEDFEDGRKITFHDSFEKGINTPCQKHFGKKCKFCKDESLRTRDFYAWSVFNYENKKVQLFLYPVNNFSPLPALVQMYEVYGNIVDRDFSISRTGKGTSTQYGVVPLDKAKFKKKDAKPFSEKKFLEILDKAYDTSPKDDSDDDDEDDESDCEMLEDLDMDQLKEVALALDISSKKIKKCKSEDSLIELIQTEADEEEIDEVVEELTSEEGDDDDEDDDADSDDDDDDEDESDYEEMTLKELKAEAKERGLKFKKGMDKEDLIELLEEDDEDED